ncbi:MAG TPA: hypothetical protein IGR64_06075 [Leptolyngbyaceae cyanobacterium M65_K2018_010]|nr:hypothetical protein [Leptolyngbyaceae cyanobacterium M65_K2018_010]
MTQTLQEKVKTEWEKAQNQGGQRFERIREIVKSAATETLTELKEGSTEIEALGRQSLAEMIAQLKAKEAAADTLGVDPEVQPEVQPEEDPGDAAQAESPNPHPPTWAEILAEFLALANDRKLDWAQTLLARLQTQMDRFDQDMDQEYGLRYRPFQPLVRGLRSLVNLAYSRMTQPGPNEPLTIEVLDDLEPPVDDSTTSAS